MKLFVTYCSAEKSPDEGLLPALERYRSSRIRALQSVAGDFGAEFRILSGKHGLLRAQDEIHDYDHLLTDSEVPAHAAKVAGQLREIGPDKVVMFSRALAVDPLVGPYRACMTEACKAAELDLTMIEIKQRRFVSEHEAAS